MNLSIGEAIGTVLQLFFLLSPFCTLSLFITFSGDMSPREQHGFAFRIALAVWFICVLFYLFGNSIFGFLGISLDAFRIGAGVVLFLTGLDFARSSGIPKARECAGGGDMAVVPMAIPYTVGPATIGILLLKGANASGIRGRLYDLVAISLVGVLLWLLLRFSRRLEMVLKEKGLSILGKLTGMYLVALAAQVIHKGIMELCKAG